MTVFRTHQQALVDIINRVNNKAVPFSDLVVGEPGPTDDVSRPDLTTVRIEAKPNTRYKDSVTARYKKLTLAQMLEALGIEHFVLPSAAASTQYLAEDLRRVYGLNIFETDIVDEPIVYEHGGVALVEIEASPDSYVYSGRALVEIGPADLAVVLTVTTLSGLNYPTA